jgi:hypothetical protein
LIRWSWDDDYGRRLLSTAVDSHRALFNVLTQDVGQLRQEMGQLRRDMGMMHEETGAMRSDIAAIRAAVAPLQPPPGA